MTNYSDISLSEELVRMRKKIINLRESINALKDKQTRYAEHHQHLINVYHEIYGVIELGIKESHDIGKGR